MFAVTYFIAPFKINCCEVIYAYIIVPYSAFVGVRRVIYFIIMHGINNVRILILMFE